MAPEEIWKLHGCNYYFNGYKNLDGDKITVKLFLFKL